MVNTHTAMTFYGHSLYRTLECKRNTNKIASIKVLRELGTVSFSYSFLLSWFPLWYLLATLIISSTFTESLTALWNRFENLTDGRLWFLSIKIALAGVYLAQVC